MKLSQEIFATVLATVIAFFILRFLKRVYGE